MKAIAFFGLPSRVLITLFPRKKTIKNTFSLSLSLSLPRSRSTVTVLLLFVALVEKTNRKLQHIPVVMLSSLERQKLGESRARCSAAAGSPYDSAATGDLHIACWSVLVDEKKICRHRRQKNRAFLAGHHRSVGKIKNRLGSVFMPKRSLLLRTERCIFKELSWHRRLTNAGTSLAARSIVLS